MAVGLQVSFDASDPARLGAFWAELLGYVEQPPPEGFGELAGGVDGPGVPEDQQQSAYAVVDPAGAGPRLFFQRVPEPKTAKNRVHLDVSVRGRPGRRGACLRARARRPSGRSPWEPRAREVEPARWALGGRIQDPDGNEFCLQ